MGRDCGNGLWEGHILTYTRALVGSCGAPLRRPEDRSAPSLCHLRARFMRFKVHSFCLLASIFVCAWAVMDIPLCSPWTSGGRTAEGYRRPATSPLYSRLHSCPSRGTTAGTCIETTSLSAVNGVSRPADAPLDHLARTPCMHAILFSARLLSTFLLSARLSSALLLSARLWSALLLSARLWSARLWSARLLSARLFSHVVSIATAGSNARDAWPRDGR